LVSEAVNKRAGIIGTVIFHALLLLLCAYLWGVRPPNPPLPDYGVEVNFGVDDSGFGDVQGTGPANDDPVAGQVASTDATVAESSPNETVVPDEENKDLATSTEKDSPLEVKDSKPEKVTEEKGKGGTDKKETKAAPETTTKTSGQGNNNGDKAGTVGDMGKPTGDLSSLNYNGDGGKGNKPGGGASLQLNGWKWDDKPDKKDPYNETGKIVFQIKVDNEGNIVEVKPIEKTVSPGVVSFYQEQVEKLSFTKTKDNTEAAEVSTGKITFIIKGN